MLGVLITIGFAFTLIGFVGEAIVVLALLGLIGRGVHFLFRQLSAPKRRSPDLTERLAVGEKTREDLRRRDAQSDPRNLDASAPS